MDNNQEELQLWQKYNDYLEGIAKENISEFLNFALWKQQQNQNRISTTSLQIPTIKLEFSEDLSKCLQLTPVLR
ncbi:MAG TPA: hypothetical protein V6D10_22480 [Trichocoleus sp.]|jgi:hypothetical protein